MNLDDILKEALEKIDSLSIDDLEKECIKAGYKPIRKPGLSSMPKFQFTENFTIENGSGVISSEICFEENFVGQATYSKTVSMKDNYLDDFGLSSADDHDFLLAA